MVGDHPARIDTAVELHRRAGAAKSDRGESLGHGFDDDGGEPRGGRRERAAAVVQAESARRRQTTSEGRTPVPVPARQVAGPRACAG